MGKLCVVNIYVWSFVQRKNNRKKMIQMHEDESEQKYVMWQEYSLKYCLWNGICNNGMPIQARKWIMVRRPKQKHNFRHLKMQAMYTAFSLKN